MSSVELPRTRRGRCFLPLLSTTVLNYCIQNDKSRFPISTWRHVFRVEFYFFATVYGATNNHFVSLDTRDLPPFSLRTERRRRRRPIEPLSLFCFFPSPPPPLLWRDFLPSSLVGPISEGQWGRGRKGGKRKERGRRRSRQTSFPTYVSAIPAAKSEHMRRRSKLRLLAPLEH